MTVLSLGFHNAFSSSFLTILHFCPHSHLSKSNTKVISSGKSDHSKISPKLCPAPHQKLFNYNTYLIKPDSRHSHILSPLLSFIDDLKGVANLQRSEPSHQFKVSSLVPILCRTLLSTSWRKQILKVHSSH